MDDWSLPAASQLAKYRLSAQHPLTREWVADDLRLELLAAECAGDLLLATDLEIAELRAELRAERFAPGRPAHLLLNRWCEVTDGLSAMLSMRYEGLDVGLPFVDASLVSRPVESGDLPHLQSAAMDAYGALGPLYLRLWDARPDGAIAGTVPDRRFLAAPLCELRAGPWPPPHLRLRPVEAATHHGALLAAYADVDHDYPGHVRQAWASTRAELDESASAGTLFDVLLDGEWSGYVGAHLGDDTLGMPAWVVQELALAPGARGRGYGRYLSGMLARQLSDERPVLVGTIHADNFGARTGALAAGRHDVGGWVQTPLPASRR